MKKSSMPQNVLIIDSDYDEARDFVKGCGRQRMKNGR